VPQIAAVRSKRRLPKCRFFLSFIAVKKERM
jgi:hypothetical protein